MAVYGLERDERTLVGKYEQALRMRVQTIQWSRLQEAITHR